MRRCRLEDIRTRRTKSSTSRHSPSGEWHLPGPPDGTRSALRSSYPSGRVVTEHRQSCAARSDRDCIPRVSTVNCQLKNGGYRWRQRSTVSPAAAPPFRGPDARSDFPKIAHARTKQSVAKGDAVNSRGPGASGGTLASVLLRLQPGAINSSRQKKNTDVFSPTVITVKRIMSPSRSWQCGR